MPRHPEYKLTLARLVSLANEDSWLLTCYERDEILGWQSTMTRTRRGGTPKAIRQLWAAVQERSQKKQTRSHAPFAP